MVMTAKNVLPFFRVDTQVSRKQFTLILKKTLLYIEPDLKIQIIVFGFYLDVPDNKIFAVAQLFLARRVIGVTP